METRLVKAILQRLKRITGKGKRQRKILTIYRDSAPFIWPADRQVEHHQVKQLKERAVTLLSYNEH